jgi:hypothetical protein
VSQRADIRGCRIIINVEKFPRWDPLYLVTMFAETDGLAKAS